MTIAIIGCGEVGLIYATAFEEAGHSLALCDLRPSERALAFAHERGLQLHPAPGAWIANCDIVVSVVFGTVSLAVAKQALAEMKAGALYVDMTTADPAAIRVAAALAAEQGVDYADVAILGAVALSGRRTNLLGAGSGIAATAALFDAIDAPFKQVEDGTAGDAAAIKILRSVFTKGLEALTVECFLAADQQGVTDKLHDALSDIDQASLRDFLGTLIRTHVVHAGRRLKEVEEAERQLKQAGLPVAVLPGVRALFERTKTRIEASPLPGVPATVEEAFAYLQAAPAPVAAAS
ncbi:NAD(P)-binding domain-containing protein [Novosphingobium sp.]|uniref:NAD(P)-binding domain-containing protein n=1 Tax=Novosphingobium sp. TaxID=1874826 RepID=UPI0028A62F54|nr:NAD(P)-binding domain-containing protein [Novosphingobium sp.]